MAPLSAVLITLDEERNLAAALASVSFCDELVVVDAGSRDNTCAIAAAAGARVISSTPWPGFVTQRRLAVEAARYDWVLALDADERVTPALRDEIRALRARGFGAAAYRMPRVAFYLGRWIRATDWYPDPQIRLFDRRRARWEGGLVHESVQVDGPVGRLRGDLEHHPYRDISDHMHKVDRYTSLWAEQASRDGRCAGAVAMLLAGHWAFVRNYLFKGGFRLGRTGLIVSLLNAYYTFAKLAKLAEIARGAALHRLMRILHVDSAASWRGGQNQVLLAARGMAARGHAVALACRRGGALESRARQAGVEVHGLPFGGDLNPLALVGLWRLLRRLRPDVVQLHDAHALSAGVLAARGRRRPRLVGTRRVDFRLRGWPTRWKYTACDRVVAVSTAIRNVLVESGLDDARLRLVYEGVPDRQPEPGGREALRALGVPLGAPVVGNVAALSDHKDQRTLLRAVPEVLRQVPDAHFVIVGDGPLRPALEALARELGLGARCVFTGFRDDLDRLIPAFDIFCLSSHLEGLGTSLLDAMCFARPIVATAAGGIPEAVADGVNGCLVPVRAHDALATALGRLLRDAARRQAWGAAGRERFLRLFTAERMVTDSLRVLEEAA